MAIIADYTKTTFSDHKTKKKTLSITYPEDLHISHPGYSKRGTTEEHEVPVVIETNKTTEGAYIVLTHCNFYKLVKDDLGQTLFDAIFRVYENKAAYQNDVENHLYEDLQLGQSHLINSDDDLRKKAYNLYKANVNYLKNIKDD